MIVERRSCSSLASVTIPNGVTSIGEGAFSSCTGLTSVTIPDSVTSIGNWAFSVCTGLTSVTIPNGVTSIGEGAFSSCPGLTAITMDAANPFYSSVDGVLFNKSRTTLIQCPGGKPGRYTIPESITSIGDHAFADCTGLTSVTVPDSVTNIGSQAFLFCGLTSVTIGNSVTSIGEEAFWCCFNLTSVTIGNSVTSIGYGAFTGCSSLTNVTIPNNVSSFKEEAFYECTGLTSVTIPTSVTSIETGAFYGCASLTGVYFQGNAPDDYWALEQTPATVYYLPGTTGWGATFSGRPTAPWVVPAPVILTAGSNLGVQENRFGFTISWATNTPVVVEAATDLTNPTWSPVSTKTLINGSSYFTDPQWTNSPARFYRLRSP